MAVGELGCVDGELRCIAACRALVVGVKGMPSCKDGLGASAAGDVIGESSFAGSCSIAAVADIGLGSMDGL